MKQHLSHWPHQWSRRRAGSMWKARLQLRNVEWYWVRWANWSAIHSSVRARSAEKYSGRPGVWASTPRNAASNDALLEYWWLTA